MSTSDPKIVVAMDFDNAEQCIAMAERLSPQYCRLKVGKELFTACGPKIVEQLMMLGFEIFLDLKFHDIPNTTAKAVKAAAELGVWMVNVHASGGERMMGAAREVLDKSAGRRPLLIAVTVLTSMETADLVGVGINDSPQNQVMRLAALTQRCGLDGIVCSAQEASLMRSKFGSNFCLVTPGIRLNSSPVDDQRRTMTPSAAIHAGSSYLVVGRPITHAPDPVAVCQSIVSSIQSV
uniref:orotidine-5'-phosphate decarboxylase n=1 Tax=Cellvibrio fontiphilus TaxID=1815559 RepID=UPI002B4C04C5|nr:orotidine-5'-phosphate decarboxylase [Cellvibrio fontiphilus]